MAPFKFPNPGTGEFPGVGPPPELWGKPPLIWNQKGLWGLGKEISGPPGEKGFWEPPFGGFGFGKPGGPNRKFGQNPFPPPAGNFFPEICPGERPI